MIVNDLNLVVLPLPQNPWQVPRGVYRHGIFRANILFGIQLGLGFLTYLPSALPYLVVVLLWFVVDELALAVAAGFGFGLGRAVMPIVRAFSRNREGWDIRLEEVKTIFRQTSAVLGAGGAISIIISS